MVCYFCVGFPNYWALSSGSVFSIFDNWQHETTWIMIVIIYAILTQSDLYDFRSLNLTTYILNGINYNSSIIFRRLATCTIIYCNYLYLIAVDSQQMQKHYSFVSDKFVNTKYQGNRIILLLAMRTCLLFVPTTSLTITLFFPAPEHVFWWFFSFMRI